MTRRTSPPVLAALVALIATVASASTLVSEENRTAVAERGAWLALGAGARPAALGDAFTPLADDASAVNANPGGLGQLRRINALAQYQVLTGAGFGVTYAAASMPAGRFTFGLAVAALSFDDYPVVTVPCVECRSEAPSVATDLMIAGAFAFPNPWDLPGWTGVGVEMLRQDVGGSALGVNAGGVIPLGGDWQAGWAALRLGPKPDGFGLPAVVKGGAAWRFSPRSLASFETGYRLVVGTALIGAGVEYAPVELLTFRAGYQRDLIDHGLGGIAGVSAGIGVHWKALSLDYAYQPFGDLAASHRISLAWVPRREPPPPAVPVAPLRPAALSSTTMHSAPPPGPARAKKPPVKAKAKKKRKVVPVQ